MIDVIKIDEIELAQLTGIHVIVREDRPGQYDLERRVEYTSTGPVFYWSSSSIQADETSTVAIAARWAASHGLQAIYQIA